MLAGNVRCARWAFGRAIAYELKQPNLLHSLSFGRGKFDQSGRKSTTPTLLDRQQSYMQSPWLRGDKRAVFTAAARAQAAADWMHARQEAMAEPAAEAAQAQAA